MGEILKIAKNGQWALEKNWNSKHINNVNEWADRGLPKYINKVPAAKGDLRTRMMSELSENTESRINPKTKEKEYKLFRAAALDNNNHEDKQTSWTAAPAFADYWAHTQGNGPEEKIPQKVLHAWIPEQHIHSYLAPILRDSGHEKWGEHEVVVKPHKVNIEKTFIGKDLDKRIKASQKSHGF